MLSPAQTVHLPFPSTPSSSHPSIPASPVLFRRSAPPPPPSAPPRTGPLAFGKIPAKGDFVRLGAASPALDRFDAWAQDAMREARAQRRPLTETRATPTLRLAIVPDACPHVLIGACRMSQDKVGRRYPFFAGRSVDRRLLETPLAPRWPVHWADLFDAAAALVDAGVEGRAAPDALAPRLQQLPPAPTSLRKHTEPLRRYDDALRAHPAADLWTATWGSADASQKPVFFYRLHAATTPADGPRREPPACGLVFPLPADTGALDPDYVTAAWAEIAWRIAGRPARPPSLWWTEPEPGHPGRLGVFFGDVPPSALAMLLGDPAEDVPGLCVLDSLPRPGGDALDDLRPADAALALPDRLGRLLEAPDLPLGTFLDSL